MELSEGDPTWALIERQTRVKKSPWCLPLLIFSLPCTEIAHGRHEQEPHMLSPTKGTSTAKAHSAEEDGVGGLCSPLWGRGSCGCLPGHLNTSSWSTASLPPSLQLHQPDWEPCRWWGLPLQVEKCPLRLGSAGQQQEQPRMVPHSASAPLANLPVSGWSLDPTTWQIKNKLPLILICCWKIPVDDPSPSQSQNSGAS